MYCMVDDDGKLRQRWNNKRVNAEKENIPFALSFEEYTVLVEQAKLKSSDLGFTGKNYVLARYNDTGAYVVGNCRFITHMENMAEQKKTPAQEAARKIGLKAMQDRTANMTAEEKAEMYAKIRKGIDDSPYMKKLREDAKLKNEAKRAKMNQSYTGSNNSQFGSYWITNGTVNKKWKDDKGDMPDGFYRGRK